MGWCLLAQQSHMSQSCASCVNCSCSHGRLQEKLGLPEGEQAPVVRQMVEKYIEGVCWVMRYYYEGERTPAPHHTACMLVDAI